MWKPILIVSGLIIILLGFAIGVYIMIFGTPEDSTDVFTDLGFELNPRTTNVIDQPSETTELEIRTDTQGESLRQLTTRPVAGFVAYIDEPSNTDVLRYAEQGTGHIYQLNLASGEERRVSGTTIPRVSEAQFSADGKFVAVTSLTNDFQDVFVGEINTTSDGGELVGQNVPPGADEVTLDSGNLRYLLSTEINSVGYRLDITTSEQTELFSIPFTDIRMIWSGDNIYFYNRYTAELQSGVYQIVGNQSLPVSDLAFGRTAIISESYVVLSETSSGEMVSVAQSRVDNSTNVLGVVAVPEKCTFDQVNTSNIICAAPLETTGRSYLEDWYKGILTSDDLLWQIDLANGTATLLSDLETEAGRLIDVTQIQSGVATNQVYFINKLDGTLWMYDLLAL